MAVTFPEVPVLTVLGKLLGRLPHDSVLGQRIAATVCDLAIQSAGFYGTPQTVPVVRYMAVLRAAQRLMEDSVEHIG